MVEANNYPDGQLVSHYYTPSQLSDMYVHNTQFYHHLKIKPTLNQVYLDLLNIKEPVTEFFHYNIGEQLFCNLLQFAFLPR